MRFRGLAALPVALTLGWSSVAWADPVSLIFSPEAGASWKIVQTRTITHSDPKKNSGDAIVTASLTVIEASEDGYLMEWMTRTIASNGQTIGADGPVPELLVGIPIRYNADAYGAPSKLHDFEQTMANIAKLFDKPIDAAAQARFDKTFGAMSEQTIANVFMQEASIIGQCLNFELEPGVLMEQQVQAPSPLGGPPILTNIAVKLEDAGDARRPAIITLQQAYDPASATASIMTTLEGMVGKEAAQAQLKNGKAPAVRNNSLITCHIDTRTGEPVQIISDLDSGVDGATKRDIRRFAIERQ